MSIVKGPFYCSVYRSTVKSNVELQTEQYMGTIGVVKEDRSRSTRIRDVISITTKHKRRPGNPVFLWLFAFLNK